MIDLITFELFLPNLEEVIYIEIALSDVHVPDTNIASGISNEEAAIRIITKAVWMDIVEACIGNYTFGGTFSTFLVVRIYYELQGSII